MRFDYNRQKFTGISYCRL